MGVKESKCCSDFRGGYRPLSRRVDVIRQFNSENANLGSNPESNSSSGWPLCFNNRVIIHESEIDPASLHEGDFYFCVQECEGGGVQLLLRYLSEGRVHDLKILRSQYANLLTMDWLQNLSASSDEDLCALLRHCLVTAEQGVEKMTLEQLVCGASGETVIDTGQTTVTNKQPEYSGCNAQLASKYNLPIEDDTGQFMNLQAATLNSSNTDCNEEARALHRVNDGKLVKDEVGHYTDKVETPAAISHVDAEILQSGTAILPGSRDLNGGAVILIYTQTPVWKKTTFTFSELAKILLYYHNVISKETRKKGLSVIVDAKGSTLPVLNCLLQSLYSVEASTHGAINMVHILVDRTAQCLLFQSPLFRSQIDLKIDLITSIDKVYEFVAASQLPVEMGGSYHYVHQDWIQFHTKLEAFLAECCEATQHLVHVMQELVAAPRMPGCRRQMAQLMEAQKQLVQWAVQDARVVGVQTQAEAVLQTLALHAGRMPQSPDLRSSIENARQLYRNVQEKTVQLVKLADMQLHRLEHCCQLRQFEEDSGLVLSWFCNHGDEICRHDKVADNLKGIQVQQKDFEKLYFSAMSYVEKGNKLVEEACLLMQSGKFNDYTIIKDIAKELKSQITTFSRRLEDIREKIECTSKCYHLLDKCYEWALEAMKYVANMKMGSCSCAEGLNKLSFHLAAYLQDHPAINQETFQQMLHLAEKGQNDKLYEQCKVARSRCEETDKLLKVRQATLRKAKFQLEAEQLKYSRQFVINKDKACPDLELSDTGVTYSPNNPYIQVPQTSMPLTGPSSGEQLRRWSYAGKASSPLYTPGVAASNDYLMEDLNLSEYEEFLLKEGLLKEDLSERLAASVSKMNNDADSHVQSISCSQNLQGSFEFLPREQKSSLLTPDYLSRGQGSSSENSDSNQSMNGVMALDRREQPRNKELCKTKVEDLQKEHNGLKESSVTLRKSVQNGQKRENRRSVKSLSLVTDSSDSLPSMPEEELLIMPHQTSNTSSSDKTSEERKFVWSPVPVNTHLMCHQNHGLIRHSSMADLRLTEEQVKRRKTLKLIMAEMIHTERDYVKSLQFVIENYMPQLMQENIPQSVRSKRNIIFGNIEKIYQFHSQYFLSEIEQCKNSPFQLCHCFLDHDSDFYLYALYNKNKPKSDALMIEYGSQFFKEKQNELGDKMDLASYLLKPVQRMGKYALLLKQIIKECPESEPEYNELRSAFEMVKFQLRHGNDLLAMDSLRESDVNLQEQGRLLRQDEFLVWQGRKKTMRHVFLFEDLVLFSKTRRSSTGHDIYVYKCSMKTSDIGITENVGDSGYKFEIWFRKRTHGETFTLQASGTEIKNLWIRDMSRLLWKQAIRNRETRLSEMSKMGVGSKPCLDLKPSEDNINDRFVNFSFQNRVPRSRNSIAVSSFDHLKNCKKRPHSIISVSSTSSSSSQSSSYSIFGPISMSYDPNETPRPWRRSYTICSNESGIIADYIPEDSQHRKIFERSISGTSVMSSPDSAIVTPTNSPDPQKGISATNV